MKIQTKRILTSALISTLALNVGLMFLPRPKVQEAKSTPMIGIVEDVKMVDEPIETPQIHNEVTEDKLISNLENVAEAIEQERIEQERKEEEERIKNSYLGTFKITAYCGCSICCGEWSDGITSTGTVATAGRTIAVDPNVIPYGTAVTFNGRTYIAEDCGGAIKGNRIDLYFDNHQDALEFGIQYFEVHKAM